MATALASLNKKRASRVMGIDCSTYTLAFAIFEDKKPVKCGEINFEGANLYERLRDAHAKIAPLVESGLLDADYIAFEGAIIVNGNAKTGISLAYVYGAVMAVLMQKGMEVITVGPITWQTYIGNPNLKKAEREHIQSENPGKSASWYKNAGREFRKQRTLAFSKKFFNIQSDSDNIGDAVGIAWYACNKLVA